MKFKKTKSYRQKVLWILPLLIGLIFVVSYSSQKQEVRQRAAAPAGMREVPDPLYGVTVDDISNLSGIIESLSHFNHKPTTRIVFDGGQSPSYYSQAVSQIQPVSYILGMLADSTAIKSYTSATYAQRTTDYLNAFGNQVDIWEVGNEVNGEWLGTDVPAKIVNAYSLVKQAGKRTALTLYYNGLDDTHNCYQNSNNLMFRWAQSNIPDTMKNGLDYVFISFYEQDCSGVSKDWKSVFTQLHQMFPHAKIGFGENGTTNATDAQSLKLQYINEYYPVWIDVPCYVSGHFWWYYYEDGIPYSNNILWQTLNISFNSLNVPQSSSCDLSGGVTPTLTSEPITLVPTLYCLGGVCPGTPTLSVIPTAVPTIEPTGVPTAVITQLPVKPTDAPTLPKSSGSFMQLILQFFMQLFALILSIFNK